MVKFTAIARGDTGFHEVCKGWLQGENMGSCCRCHYHTGGRWRGNRLRRMSLDFSKGLYLEGLDRGIVACSGATLHGKIIYAVHASWGSSSL